MIPIHQLLNRIQWDQEFGRGEFTIGYRDRFEEALQHVPLSAVTFPDDDHHVFQTIDADGHTRRIPFHRVREVLKDGRVIWSRE